MTIELFHTIIIITPSTFCVYITLLGGEPYYTTEQLLSSHLIPTIRKLSLAYSLNPPWHQPIDTW